MAETTGIQWTEATWNPWYGCEWVSGECDLCYMFSEMRRYGKDPEIITRSKTKFSDPLKWARAGKSPKFCFTCSWSDWANYAEKLEARAARAEQAAKEAEHDRDAVYALLVKQTARYETAIAQGAEHLHNCAAAESALAVERARVIAEAVKVASSLKRTCNIDRCCDDARLDCAREIAGLLRALAPPVPERSKP